MMYRFLVNPKIAGIESKANSTFVVDIAMRARTNVDAPFDRKKEISLPSFHSSASVSRKSCTAV